MIGFYVFIAIVVSQRAYELMIANKNAQLLKREGGYEVGAEHYKYIVALHVLFFIALISEVTITRPSFASWVILPFFAFLLAQIGRIWVISSLGKYWNTRIIVVPGANVVNTGPYRYFRHPNYAIVMTEIVMLPLMFQAYWTALTFTVLNALLLSYRIKVEEQALKEVTNYNEVF